MQPVNFTNSDKLLELLKDYSFHGKNINRAAQLLAQGGCDLDVTRLREGI